MRLTIREETLLRCPACQGGGKTTPIPAQWILQLANLGKYKSEDLACLTAGTCIVCKGRGWYKEQTVIASISVSVWGWLKYHLLGWEPDELKSRFVRRSDSTTPIRRNLPPSQR